MLDAATLQWIALASLNAVVAVLLAQVRPRTAAYLWLAVLFATNAFATPLIKLAEGTSDAAHNEPWFSLGAFLEISTIVPLLVLPFLLPAPRLSRPGTRRLHAVAGTLYATIAVIVFLGVGPRSAPEAPTSIALGLALRLVLITGIVCFAQDVIESRGSWRQAQSRLYLGAFLLPLAALLPFESEPANATLVGIAPVLFSPITWEPVPGPLVMRIMGALDLVALVLPVAILVAARLRGRLPGRSRRLAHEVGFVAAFVAIGILFGHHAGTLDLAWSFARPALFVTAVFAFRIVDWGKSGTRWLVPAAVVATFACILFVSLAYGTARGLDGATATAIGLVLGVALLVGLARPLARHLLNVDGGASSDDRRRYRHALEASLDADHRGSEWQLALRDLRARLGLREADHVDAVAELALSPADASVASAIADGRYRLVRPLGAGGSGRVDLAWDERMGREVVVKRALADTPDTRARLVREARVLARLDHPHIVAINDILEDREGLRLVMEYVPGGSLHDRLEQGAVTPHDAKRWGLEVLDALAVAHAHHIIHRDIKPSNVLLTRSGQAVVADFGTATLTQAGTATIQGFTRPGEQPGTVAYMAPEQVRGTAVDARTDLYAVAALLYRCVVGRSYLGLEDLPEYDARVAIVEEPPDLDVALPRPWIDFFAKGLAKDPALRFPDAASMRAALAALPEVWAAKPAKKARNRR